MKLQSIFSVLVTLVSVDFHLQEDQQQRAADANQALRAGDFDRAERIALAVIQSAEKDSVPRWAQKVYGECRFRSGGYHDAISLFQVSVRQNSDERVNAMLAISAMATGDRTGTSYLGRLTDPAYAAKRLSVAKESLPRLNSATASGDANLAYAWLILAWLDKGEVSIKDAKSADKLSPGNASVNWVLAVRHFELAQYKDAKARYQVVAKSKVEEMVAAAKKQIELCDKKLKVGK